MTVNPATGRYPSAGRPSLLTPDTHDRIVEVVSAGNYLKTAAAYVGISVATLQSWMARGRAAAAQLDLHADGHRLCPRCEEDREAEVRDHEADAEHATDTTGHPVLNRCPICDSPDAPVAWELPDSEEPYLRFLGAVTQAETKAEVAAVTHWRRAFADDWRAARDYLSRKRPDMWAAKTTVAISSEEAEARIERATFEALAALGIDTEGAVLPGDDDPSSLDDGEPLDF